MSVIQFVVCSNLVTQSYSLYFQMPNCLFSKQITLNRIGLLWFSHTVITKQFVVTGLLTTMEKIKSRSNTKRCSRHSRKILNIFTHFEEIATITAVRMECVIINTVFVMKDIGVNIASIVSFLYSCRLLFFQRIKKEQLEIKAYSWRKIIYEI